MDWSLPGWPDASERIGAGVRRRRTRRRLSVTLATVLTASVLFGLPSFFHSPDAAVPPSTFSAIEADGAWVDPPATLQRRSPRADRSPCQPNLAQPLTWMNQESPTDLVVFYDPPDTDRCTLSGAPKLMVTDPVNLTRVFLDAPTAEAKPNARKQFPATVDGGEPARFDITTDDNCPAHHYTDLAFVVGGQEIPFSVPAVDGVCFRSVSPWYVEAPLINAPLTVTIQSPKLVAPGRDFTYEVTVLNASDYPVRPGGCLIYQQGIAGKTEWFRLDCTREEFPAHTPVRYRMRARAPQQTPDTEITLTWMAALPDGTVAIGNLSTGGLKLIVTPSTAAS
jgi:hypothetical protein